ncbi:hypothetical protein GS504_01780 [Rhodococcus hoagii]|nr:hypothetical protein [Prescottella equi]NKS72247.1 hypothetical protein [Prescottella equi]
MPTEARGRVGNVSRRRYEQLVDQGRDLVEQQTRCQFALGDAALEIEPLHPHGGAHLGPDAELLTVSQALELFADDIGAPYCTIRTYRWVSARWPAAQRQPTVSHHVHRILAAIPDDEERYAAIASPPLQERTGERRWTSDTAKRRVGWRVDTPLTLQEKVERIHDLAADDDVAAAVASDLLRRPAVATKAMTDATARHVVRRARIEQMPRPGDIGCREIPAAEHTPVTTQFIDLVGVCAAFVSGVGRVLPEMRGHRFTTAERAAVHMNVARVRATATWIENAADTGHVGLDEGLARLLRGG